MPRIQFNLNGTPTEASYEPGMHFLEVLREECGIVSPKDGCAPEGTCGCCLVLIDGHPALSCLRKPEQMAGHDVVTVEGLPDDTRRILGEASVPLHRLRTDHRRHSDGRRRLQEWRTPSAQRAAPASVLW